MSVREHSAAAADARAHLAGLGREPLAPLPEGFAEGRDALHRVAEETLQIRGREQRGAGWLRPYTPGGVGSPPWDVGAESGRPGSIRVEGAELVTVTGEAEEREPIAVDPAVTAALADFYALTTVALDDLIEASGDAGADPIRLWPEHFDAATTIGDETAGTRANYGGSPGDENHPEPYLYVGCLLYTSPSPRD